VLKHSGIMHYGVPQHWGLYNLRGWLLMHQVGGGCSVTAMSVTSKHPVLSGVMEINGVTTVMPQTKMQSGLLLES
jgi:hypothetical protein